MVRSRRTRTWKSDADYIADQDDISSWSGRNSPWGDAASTKFIKFGRWLQETGKLFHNDTVADFGGNDGTASYRFYQEHKIRPLVVDCEPRRIKWAREYYGLRTYQTFIESMPRLADKSIDWGFCSHTIEHTREPEKALRELSRVIRRGCYFIFPLECIQHARTNHAHAVSFTRLRDWTRLVASCGWSIDHAEKVGNFEAQMVAIPHE